MPELTWIGKDKVINHHQEVPFRVLEKRYAYGADCGGNMVIHGDNLEALKALLPRYEGRVKCVYIDPPYNTGNEGWVYNDNVNDPKIRKWLGEVVGREGEDLSRHDKWLCMMYPRLKLLQRLLAEDGAIFISIDDNEQANLKLICDEIFGLNSFVSLVSWQRTYSMRNDSLGIPAEIEHILVYSKIVLVESQEISAMKAQIVYNRGQWPRFYFTNSGRGGIRRKTYMDKVGGKPATNYWPFSETGHTDEAKKDLLSIFGGKVTFDTPKPSRLIERVLQIASAPDSIILDSFAGSGTTAHAVLNMNKADGGNRKFILVELMDYADSITAERVKRVIDGYGQGKGAVEGTGGGFGYYELGEPLLIGDNLNESVGVERIREYIWYTETRAPYSPAAGRSPYYLGAYGDTDYYFYYEPDRATILDHAFLSSISEKAGSYVIYADRCALSAAELSQYGVTFKKIPRDIARV